jgi:hypothetical protein
MAVTKDEIENLAVHVDQLLVSHERNGVDWLPLPKVVAEGLQLLLKDLRPGPRAASASVGTSSPAPADPPLPGSGPVPARAAVSSS